MNISKEVNVNEMRTNALRAGHEITAFFPVRAMDRKKSRNNRDYLVFKLTRDTDAINGYLWGALEMGNKIRPGCRVKVKGHVKSLNNTNLIVIKQIRPATESEVNADDGGCYQKVVARRVGERTGQDSFTFGRIMMGIWPECQSRRRFNTEKNGGIANVH